MAETATNCGAEPQSTGLVQSEGKLPPSAEVVTNSVAQPPSPVSIDSVSKALAVVLVLVYVAGFLITSLHNFKYGFSEMNPLRPRILAAGGWFAIFMAVPFTLVWELKKHHVLKVKTNKLSEFANFVALYMASGFFLVSFSGGLFAFDKISDARLPWWDIGEAWLIVFVGAAMVGLVVAQRMNGKLPTWATSLLIIPFYGYMLWAMYYELFREHTFQSNVANFWLLVAGGYIYLELNARGWTLQAGRWERTLVGFFIMMTIFATVYYPHIMAKWGGGALIPIELTFSKDTPVRSGLQLDCSLIDETDAGFYVIGNGGASATFIPRSEISSIYYGQGNGHSVLTDSLPQQNPLSPPNSPPSTQPTPVQVTAPQKPVSATSSH